MKLNYRDRVFLGILLAVVVLVGGFFLFIKPKNEEIKSNKAELARVQQEQKEVQAKLDEIEPLKNQIKEIYRDTKKLTDDFMEYNDMYNTRAVDQYMQSFATDCKVKIKTLSASNLAAEKLDYYYFKPSIVAEDMLKKANINNGDTVLTSEEKIASDALAARTQETALGAQYTITVEAEEKEDIWKYLEAIEKQDKTIIIKSVALQNILMKDNKYTNPNKNKPKDPNEIEAKPTALLNITLYSVYEMPEPNVEMN